MEKKNTKYIIPLVGFRPEKRDIIQEHDDLATQLPGIIAHVVFSIHSNMIGGMTPIGPLISIPRRNARHVRTLIGFRILHKF